MAHYWTQFTEMVQNMHFLMIFRTNLHYVLYKFSIINLKTDAGTALSKDAIREESSKEHQQESIKKYHI